ncbi:predicted protein [Sclerotinia sclerotiorum 1980 UF-70]|uniref:Uncharacterized protein n=2 Tax=Sclerotinia sclerotiorum (strain ATCC 18683 / 1980 / Ss-1) TaxID=665079 RepID=A7F3C6_SCLS1|nr:predicted protein [Sclerotinia sclerotiorum 1980 UF-70]APA14388.1 hypothetical protein sscle_12g091580 [Sclerotinia sclerotiorum 1980 UF-70]EDN97247.1 predicted protein [Sclerotinia sclerotiorum 1980 UF-70]
MTVFQVGDFRTPVTTVLTGCHFRQAGKDYGTLVPSFFRAGEFEDFKGALIPGA